MPLIKSGTKAARDQNIAEMVRAGHPVNQSVAAAYRNARQHGGHFADGGDVPFMPGGRSPLPSNLDIATQEMNLTPQEQYLYNKHLNNLISSNGGVQNPNEPGKSTLYQSVVEKNGRYYNIPTLWDGKFLSPDDAQTKAETEGLDKFPSYSSPEAADKRYMQMHDYMGEDLGNFNNFAPGGRIDAPADAPHVTPSDRRGFDELMSIAQPPDSRSSGKPFMPGGYADGGTIAKGGHGGLYAPPGVVGTGWMSTKDRLYYLEGKGGPKGLSGYDANSSSDNFSHFAAGGAAASPPWFIRNEARTMGHQGFIGSIVPGRTDKHPMTVAGGSYVVPADVVSSIGQGNSLAGASKLGQMLRSGPYGSAAAAVPKSVKAIRQKFADGGDADPSQSGEPAEIVTAGGEYIIGPQDVHRLGGGNLDHGHSVLDEMVKHVRKSTIKTLRKLPGPKGAKK